jgi:hypothetical protein
MKKFILYLAVWRQASVLGGQLGVILTGTLDGHMATGHTTLGKRASPSLTPLGYSRASTRLASYFE